MADDEHHLQESPVESVLENLVEKIHRHDSSSSSSSDSDDDKKSPLSPSMKNKVFRLFGREKPVYKVLGGGKRMFLIFELNFFISFINDLTFWCTNFLVMVKKISIHLVP